MKHEKIRLGLPSFLDFIQGKDLNIQMKDFSIILQPPYEGVFLTHAQVKEMQKNAIKDAFKELEDQQKGRA